MAQGAPRAEASRFFFEEGSSKRTPRRGSAALARSLAVAAPARARALYYAPRTRALSARARKVDVSSGLGGRAGQASAGRAGARAGATERRLTLALAAPAAAQRRASARVFLLASVHAPCVNARTSVLRLLGRMPSGRVPWLRARGLALLERMGRLAGRRFFALRLENFLCYCCAVDVAPLNLDPPRRRRRRPPAAAAKARPLFPIAHPPQHHSEYL
jgi:hypothetical protein